jgi:hypothetical protein
MDKIKLEDPKQFGYQTPMQRVFLMFFSKSNARTLHLKGEAG